MSTPTVFSLDTVLKLVDLAGYEESAFENPVVQKESLYINESLKGFAKLITQRAKRYNKCDLLNFMMKSDLSGLVNIICFTCIKNEKGLEEKNKIKFRTSS